MKVQKDGFMQGEENERYESRDRDKNTSDWFLCGELVLPTLVYPAVRSHLDQQNYENRELASFPELSAANFDNIPTEFEAYYNDHVPFKNLFVKGRRQSWIWSF